MSVSRSTMKVSKVETLRVKPGVKGGVVRGTELTGVLGLDREWFRGSAVERRPVGTEGWV